MPVDLRLFRLDTERWKIQINESLKLRKGPCPLDLSEQDDSSSPGGSIVDNEDPLLCTFLECHDNASRGLQQLVQAKRQYKNQQRQRFETNRKVATAKLPPDASETATHVTGDIAKQCPEPPKVSKKDLQRLEEAYQKAQEDLQQSLRKLPNFLDLDATKDLSEEYASPRNHTVTLEPASTSSKTVVTLSSVSDPFFCIGGYEELPIHTNSVDNNRLSRMLVLTYVGQKLQTRIQDALIDYWSHTFLRDIQLAAGSETKTSMEILYLPSTIPVVSDHCSWKSVLQSKDGEIYYDKSLPKVYLLRCHGLSNSIKGNNNTVKKSITASWYDRVTPESQTELQSLLLTGSSTVADSRPLQRQWLEQVASLYQDWLMEVLSANGWDKDSRKGRAHFQIISIEPHKLESDEASRLELHATLHFNDTHSSKSKATRTLVLAHLSNYLDYYTGTRRDGRTTNDVFIRHGSSCVDGKYQGVHVLHGRLCRTLDFLDVLVSLASTVPSNVNTNGTVQPSSGMFLPFPSVSPSQGIDWTARFFYPYVRMVKFGKKGQRIIETVSKDAAVSPISAAPQVHKTGSLLCAAGSVTASDIEFEARACPFGFFPFTTSTL